MNKITKNLIKQTWGSITSSYPDPILGLTVAFNASTNPNKVNLGVGAYRNNEGKFHMLESVKAAQARQQGKPIDYAPIDGLPEFIKAAQTLAFGELAGQLDISTVQTLSGTGSLRVGAEFIRDWMGIADPIGYSRLHGNPYIVRTPEPTWPTHDKILQKSGIASNIYTYYDRTRNQLDFGRMCRDIIEMKFGSVVMFHACAHNPTGTDPNLEQWKELSHICKSKGHVVWFDSAYQGFASGDLSADSESYKIFIRDGHPIILSQSFAKNMGLYGMRIGALHVVTANSEEKTNVTDKLKTIIRPMYSSPPVEGARIVAEIVSDPLLSKLWASELKEMAGRIVQMRTELRTRLESANPNQDWSHITRQIGMFAYTGLNSSQVNSLINKHHIFLTSDGRISIPGLNTANIDYVANCISLVMKD